MGGGFKHSLKGKRNDNDFYPTHHSMTKQFLDQFKIPEHFGIHDPACGNNDIIKAVKSYGLKNRITGKDLSTGDDFLFDINTYDIIFTNPPFSMSTLFLEKAFMVAKEFVIYLLPLDYLHGKDRYDSFFKVQKDFYLSEVHVFIRRPMFTDSVRDDECYETGSVTFAWFVWKKIKDDIIQEPILKWIDNNEYVIGSRKKTKIKEQMLMNF